MSKHCPERFKSTLCHEAGEKKKKGKRRENPQTTNVETIWNDLIHASNPFVLPFPCSAGEFELNAIY